MERDRPRGPLQPLDMEEDLAHPGEKLLALPRCPRAGVGRCGFPRPSVPWHRQGEDGSQREGETQGSVTAPADKAAFGREDISICSADT